MVEFVERGEITAQQLSDFIIAKFNPSKRISYTIPWFMGDGDTTIDLGNGRTISCSRALGVDLIEYFGSSTSATEEPH